MESTLGWHKQQELPTLLFTSGEHGGIAFYNSTDLEWSLKSVTDVIGQFIEIDDRVGYLANEW